MANPDYVNGELASATYANGSHLAVAPDNYGRTASLAWTGLLSSVIATDVVDRSQTGRVVDETIDGVDANPEVDPDLEHENFEYDGAGRLTDAWVPDHTLAYGYGANGDTSCTALNPVSAGLNGNRTSMVKDGGTPTTYCHDGASRLLSSSDTAVGSPTYDARGNTTVLGAQHLLYDGADRHTETRVTGGATVRYVRDATDASCPAPRAPPSSATASAVPATRRRSPWTKPTPSFERSIALAGGVMLSKRAGLLGVNDVWSYPNIHGDVVAAADSRRGQAGNYPRLRPLRRGPGRPRHRQLARRLRLRLAGPAPAGHRARRRHRHHRDGGTTVCAGAGAVPVGGSCEGGVVQRLRLHVRGSGRPTARPRRGPSAPITSTPRRC